MEKQDGKPEKKMQGPVMVEHGGRGDRIDQ